MSSKPTFWFYLDAGINFSWFQSIIFHHHHPTHDIHIVRLSKPNWASHFNTMLFAFDHIQLWFPHTFDHLPNLCMNFFHNHSVHSRLQHSLLSFTCIMWKCNILGFIGHIWPPKTTIKFIYITLVMYAWNLHALPTLWLPNPSFLAPHFLPFSYSWKKAIDIGFVLRSAFYYSLYDVLFFGFSAQDILVNNTMTLNLT